MVRRPPSAVLGGSADEIEAQFYEALQAADIDKLMALWADDDEIVCVHPGGARVVGPRAIRASFEAIFANGAVPARPEGVHRLQWHGGALHHLQERIEVRTAEGVQVAYVVASNVYVKTSQGWRLAAHHASPGLEEPPPVLADAPSTLH